MRTIHGDIRSTVRVNVDDHNATPETAETFGYEYVPGFGYFSEHEDSTFSIDPDGTLQIYGDMSEPAHDRYGRNTWLHVTDEHNNGVFNTAHTEARPDGEPGERTPRERRTAAV